MQALSNTLIEATTIRYANILQSPLHSDTWSTHTAQTGSGAQPTQTTVHKKLLLLTTNKCTNPCPKA
jgi:hypothetical protein